uniref:BIRD-IDD transcription factor fourth C2HC zinc finger domain-containing protein n=1 Tax=Nelumbo nucifera TaxID=4432 RepID=A0A822ZSS1_NELNU|nr:TPA_asm: hypothetical protein HUJ06_017880 [Nelumbo nucifera]
MGLRGQKVNQNPLISLLPMLTKKNTIFSHTHWPYLVVSFEVFFCFFLLLVLEGIRKDSFFTHRAFCDALAEESARLSRNLSEHPLHLHPQNPTPLFPFLTQPQNFPNQTSQIDPPHNPNSTQNPVQIKAEAHHHHHQQQHQIPTISPPPLFYDQPSHKQLIASPLQHHLQMATDNPNSKTNTAHMSATALLQKAANFGAAALSSATQTQPVGHHITSSIKRLDEYGKRNHVGFPLENLATWQKNSRLTRDFLGLTGDCEGGINVKDLLSFAGGVEFTPYDRDVSLLIAEHATSGKWGGDYGSRIEG